jgi:DNA-directed RNA polymerase subunit RPC12/RpoP
MKFSKDYGKCKKCGSNNLKMVKNTYQCKDCNHNGLVTDWIEKK